METLRLHSHRCCFAFHRNGDAQRFAGKLKPSFDQFVQNLRFFFDCSPWEKLDRKDVVRSGQVGFDG